MRLDTFEAQADAFEREHDASSDLVVDLLNNECDPCKAKNIMDAIAEECLFQNGGIERMVELMEERDTHQLGRFVYDRIISYWETQAENQAEEQRAKSWGYEER